jgi:quinol monooxygenase YgiN
MRVTVGWLRLNPGARDAFLRDIVRPFAAVTRAEDGCLFFEMTASADDPDMVVIVQSFRDAAAHAAHTASLHEAKLRRDLETIGVRGDFLNLDTSDPWSPDELTFPTSWEPNRGSGSHPQI